MDWRSIAPLVGAAAPTLGQILGGLIPFPGGALLGQVAGSILADALGVPQTPQAVANAIQTRPAEEVQAALSEAEARIAAEVERHKADLADVADARSSNVALVQAGSAIAYGPVVISTLIVLGFVGCVFSLMVLRIDFSQTSGQAFLILTGVLSQAFAQVTGYWLGSSAGSADKSNQLAALAANAIPKPTNVVPLKKRA